MSDEKLVVLLMIVVNGLGLWLSERFRPHSSESALDRRRHLATNLALSGLLITLNFAFDGAAAAAGAQPWSGGFGILKGARLPGWTKVLVVVVTLDGLAYLAHVLMHKLSPAWRFHRVHHSDMHVDVTTAYSNIFSIWDRLFGTYRPPRPDDKIVFGLDGCDAPERQRTAGLLALPFGS